MPITQKPNQLYFRLLLIIMMLSGHSLLFSQDLVVLSSGDSVNCKITKVENQQIYFTVRVNEEEFQQEILNLWQINDYERGYYGKPKVFMQEKNPAFRAEDLILLNSGDSIFCEIVMVRDQKIFFNYQYNDNHIQQESLDLWKIADYQRSFEKQEDKQQVLTVPVKKAPTSFTPNAFVYTEFRVNFRGGYSYLIAKTEGSMPSEFEKYIKELRSGGHLGLDATYFFSEQYGLGISYSSFFTSNELNNVTFDFGDGTSQTGTIGDDIHIGFIGLAFNQRIEVGRGNTLLHLKIAAGSLSYMNNAIVLSRIDLTGNAFGLMAGVDLDFRISDNVALGFGASLVGGAIKKMTFDDGTNSITQDLGDNPENISRIDVSGGVRIYF